jgi:hypothetical protein
MKCNKIRGNDLPGNGGINPTYHFLRCRTPNVFDAGYIFNVSFQPVIHQYPATLEEDNFAGAELVANMKCEK